MPPRSNRETSGVNAVELATRKQRLLHDSAVQRKALTDYAVGLRPAFGAADRVRAGAFWMRRHPEIVFGGVALLAASSSATRGALWRWSRRGFSVWRLWRDGKRWIDAAIRRS